MIAATPPASTLAPPLLERVLERLGLESHPAPDLAGLGAVYGAWCARVPFDNVRKLIALRTGAPGPLPGSDAVDFFTHWLRHGTGGTCWPSSNALFTLVEALGFPARRVAGSMRDMGARNHGSVKVRLDGRDWLVDSSMLTNRPLPLGDDVHVHGDPVLPLEIEHAALGEEGTHILWFDNAPPQPWLPCRLLDDPVGLGFYLDRYERSRVDSPFNGMVVARRSGAELVRVLRGPKWSRRTPAGIEACELGPEEVCRTLIEEVGVSEAMVDAWRECGGLDASFAPSSTPAPPPETRLAPSRRAAGGTTGAG